MLGTTPLLATKFTQHQIDQLTPLLSWQGDAATIAEKFRQQLLPSLKGKKYERARADAEAAVSELAELERMVNAAGVPERLQFETGFAPPLDSRAPGVYFEVVMLRKSKKRQLESSVLAVGSRFEDRILSLGPHSRRRHVFGVDMAVELLHAVARDHAPPNPLRDDGCVAPLPCILNHCFARLVFLVLIGDWVRGVGEHGSGRDGR
jgi:hypothetical protein